MAHRISHDSHCGHWIFHLFHQSIQHDTQNKKEVTITFKQKENMVSFFEGDPWEYILYSYNEKLQPETTTP